MNSSLRRLSAVVVAAGVVAAAAACGSSDDNKSGSGSGGKTLTVLAASSLTDTFTELGREFETAHAGVKVRFSFQGSAQLAQQITSGAPADVFAAASPATMKTVTDAGDATGTPTVFVRNKLEIAVPPANKAGVKSLQDLANPKIKVVLCAVAQPCGAAAQQVLTATGLKIKPVSLEADVKSTLTKVELGEADAGLVYQTDVLAAAGKVTGIQFPEADKAINSYPIATLKNAPQQALAKDFVRLVLSAQGTAVLTKAGFEAP